MSTQDIKCSFVRMVNPRSTTMFGFLRQVFAVGIAPYSTALVAVCVSYIQHGFVSLLTGRVPDIFRLDEAAPISHPDLFADIVNLPDLLGPDQCHIDKVRTIKYEYFQHAPSVSSEVETCLLFLWAGGDYTTGLVDPKSLLRCLEAKAGQVVGVPVGSLSMWKLRYYWPSAW